MASPLGLGSPFLGSTSSAVRKANLGPSALFTRRSCSASIRIAAIRASLRESGLSIARCTFRLLIPVGAGGQPSVLPVIRNPGTAGHDETGGGLGLSSPQR